MRNLIASLGRILSLTGALFFMSAFSTPSTSTADSAPGWGQFFINDDLEFCCLPAYCFCGQMVCCGPQCQETE